MDDKIVSDRRLEYAKLFCSWVEKCLIEDEKWEELAYFKMGLDLIVKQRDLKDITWEQIDFPYVNDIKYLKVIRDENGNHQIIPGIYEQREISKDTFDILNKISDTKKGKIFRNFDYNHSIRESTGTEFNGHTRILGITLKMAAMESK